MTKAATALPTTSHRINRRALFRGGSLAAVALASPTALTLFRRPRRAEMQQDRISTFGHYFNKLRMCSSV
jgi:hypothetical protein